MIIWKSLKGWLMMKEIEKILKDYDYRFKGTLLDDFKHETESGNLSKKDYLDLLVHEWIPCWIERDREYSIYLIVMQRKLQKILKELEWLLLRYGWLFISLGVDLNFGSWVSEELTIVKRWLNYCVYNNDR